MSTHAKKTRTVSDLSHVGHLKLLHPESATSSSLVTDSKTDSKLNNANSFKDLNTQTLSNLITVSKWGDIPEWAYGATRSILEALKKADPETYHHCVRVGEYSRLLAKSAGLNEYEQKVAEFAGLLHDVGKMGIPQEIVHKPGKLDEHEYLTMKNHSVYSEEIVRPLEKHHFFKQVNPCVRAHHERVDGQGHPDRLAGEEIPVVSRVILIVDTMDAMGQDRAYRKGLPIDVIYKEIKKFSGTQFDSSLAKIFLDSHQYWSQEVRDPTTYQEIVLKVA